MVFAPRPTLGQLRVKLQEFCSERDWHKFHTPRNLCLALVGEVGELCEIFQWHGEVRPGVPELNDRERVALEHELADVLLYLIRLADVCEVDLPTVALKKIELNAHKYPAELARGSAAKYTELVPTAEAIIRSTYADPPPPAPAPPALVSHGAAAAARGAAVAARGLAVSLPPSGGPSPGASPAGGFASVGGSSAGGGSSSGRLGRTSAAPSPGAASAGSPPPAPLVLPATGMPRPDPMRPVPGAKDFALLSLLAAGTQDGVGLPSSRAASGRKGSTPGSAGGSAAAAKLPRKPAVPTRAQCAAPFAAALASSRAAAAASASSSAALAARAPRTAAAPGSARSRPGSAPVRAAGAGRGSALRQSAPVPPWSEAHLLDLSTDSAATVAAEISTVLSVQANPAPAASPAPPASPAAQNPAPVPTSPAAPSPAPAASPPPNASSQPVTAGATPQPMTAGATPAGGIEGSPAGTDLDKFSTPLALNFE